MRRHCSSLGLIKEQRTGSSSDSSRSLKASAASCEAVGGRESCRVRPVDDSRNTGGMLQTRDGSRRLRRGENRARGDGVNEQDRVGYRQEEAGESDSR
jgi:hypothetical protein